MLSFVNRSEPAYSTLKFLSNKSIKIKTDLHFEFSIFFSTIKHIFQKFTSIIYFFLIENKNQWNLTNTPKFCCLLFSVKRFFLRIFEKLFSIVLKIFLKLILCKNLFLVEILSNYLKISSEKICLFRQLFFRKWRLPKYCPTIRNRSLDAKRNELRRWTNFYKKRIDCWNWRKKRKWNRISEF